jgi:hypothetical protein
MIQMFRSVASGSRWRLRERRPRLDGDRVVAWLLAGLGTMGVAIWGALVAWALA